jgi:hypothetical protein
MIRAIPLRAGLLVLAAATSPAAPEPQPPTAKLEQAAPEATVAILGEPVMGPDGKPLGRLIDVMVDASGTPEAAAIDFGGFIGIGSRKIVVPWNALRFAPQESKRSITLEMTPEQIKAAPEYKGAATAPAMAQPSSAPAPGSRPPSSGP